MCEGASWHVPEQSEDNFQEKVLTFHPIRNQLVAPTIFVVPQHS